MLTVLVSTGQSPSPKLGNRGRVWPPVQLSALRTNTTSGGSLGLASWSVLHTLSPSLRHWNLASNSELSWPSDFQNILSNPALVPALNQAVSHKCPCPLFLQSTVSLDPCAKPSTGPTELPDEAHSPHIYKALSQPQSLCAFQHARWTGGEATNSTDQEETASGTERA